MSIDLVSARSALADAGHATSAPLRSFTDVDVAVPGPEWTARGGAHIIVALSAVTASATGQTLDLAGVGAEQTNERMSEVNARFLGAVPETEPDHLASRIDAELSFLRATDDRPGTYREPAPWYG